MKRAALILLALAALVAQRRRDDGFFHTTVPEHRYSLTLGRVDATSVTATVLAQEELEGYFELGGARQTETRAFAKGEPVSVKLDGLMADSAVTYRFCFRRPGAKEFERSEARAFHTRRAPGRSFRFVMQADSHLDENSQPELYRRTLERMRDEHADFLVDLGDTFMTDKRRDDYREAKAQYLAQRYWFGLAGASTPLFLVLGNHDGEDGARREMARWSLDLRRRYFPNPASASELENYYAFPWGDALIVVLDPYWPTTSRERGDLWRWTLGRAQYDWLRQTLEQSRAKYKFVFIHHPIGAKSEPVRGGVAAARYGEWGGRNADESDGFAARRPGWAMPIHALLEKHGVQAVFHGHDHFYAREELGGVVYQLVPQPANPRASLNAPRNAAEYGYTSGQLLGGSGYLRVDVGPRAARVEYVVTTSGAVAAAYELRP